MVYNIKKDHGWKMNRQLYEYSYELRKQRKRKILFFIIYFCIIYLLINIVFAFLVFPVKQVSTSMVPDFPENSICFVTPLNITMNRGDVVLLKNKVSEDSNVFQKIWHNISRFFTAQQYDSYAKMDYPDTNNQIRRVVGLPGDEIYMNDYVLYIKPQGEKHFLTEFELSKKAYNLTFVTPPSDWNGSVGVKGSFDPITLGADEYFVLGDNRIAVSDSRLWGSISKKDIKGKILVKYFPFNSIKFY